MLKFNFASFEIPINVFLMLAQHENNKAIANRKTATTIEKQITARTQVNRMFCHAMA